MQKESRYSIVLLLSILFILSTSVIAQDDTTYHLKLLAVHENDNNYTGSEADLFLELKGGSGRVFLDTYPLTKLDTQISTRFAKEIACKQFKLDCNKYDFIYTIKAKSNIIGGPSAGAAIAALTTIAMLDLSYDDKITITGTINSGGTIGPVGGVKQKLEVASDIDLEKVMIAKGTANQTENPYASFQELNQTSIDLVAYGKDNLSLEVMEVVDLAEVIFLLTGTQLNHQEVDVQVNQEYTKIMHGLQRMLCGRMVDIEKGAYQAGVERNITSIIQRKEQMVNATEREDYYSAASFCFSNNVQLKKQEYNQKKLSKAMIARIFSLLEKKVVQLEEKVEEEKIDTIADLQTSLVVKQRLQDVREQIIIFREENRTLEELYEITAYAEERFYSALSWMQFFAMDGKKFVVNEKQLADSCSQKILESEERHQYAALFIGPLRVQGIRQKIDTAKEAQSQENSGLCLITAVQAKAEANAVLSSLGLTEESFPVFLESKQKAVERVIADNSIEKIFPILGYSYYQYALSLEDKFAALMYLEYALEMSDLSIYFPEQQDIVYNVARKVHLGKEWIYFGLGIIVGLGIALLFSARRRRKKRHHTKVLRIS